MRSLRKGEGESLEHLFFNCPRAYLIWFGNGCSYKPNLSSVTSIAQ